jgi:transcription factor TFIIIB component B''
MDGGDLASLAMLGVPAPLGSDAPPASHQLPPQLMTATPAETSIGSAPHFPHLAFPAPEAGSSAGPSGSNAQESSSNDDEVLVRKNHAPRRRTKKPRPMVIDDENDAPLVEKKRARTKKEKGRQKASDSAAESGAESSSVQPPKRRRKATKLETPADGAAPAPAARRGRKRAPSPPPFDAHADPGEEPDPTRVAMADLVEDSGRGRVSARGAEIVSNHAAWKAASKVRRAALRAKVEAKKYGRAEDEDAALQEKDEVGVVKEGTAPPADEDVLPNPDMADEDAATPEPPLAEDDDAPADENAFDYAQRVNTSRFTVQVRIGPNGETVVDEQSLFVDRGEGEDDTAGYTHVEESDLTKFVNSASHSKKPTGSRWSAEETELFFDVRVSCLWGDCR